MFQHTPRGYQAAYNYAKKIGGQLSRDRRGYVVDPAGTILSPGECAMRGERYFITSFAPDAPQQQEK